MYKDSLSKTLYGASKQGPSVSIGKHASGMYLLRWRRDNKRREKRSGL